MNGNTILIIWFNFFLSIVFVLMSISFESTDKFHVKHMNSLGPHYGILGVSRDCQISPVSFKSIDKFIVRREQIVGPQYWTLGASRDSQYMCALRNKESYSKQAKSLIFVIYISFYF